MTFYESVLSHIRSAADVLGIAPDAADLLLHPQHELHVSIPFERDDGSTEIVEGYRIQWNDARGPYKGGIRFHPKVNLDEVRALACSMAIKTAALGLPLGGAKGGVAIDPKQYSQSEQERVMRGFVRAIVDSIGPDKDIPAPDVNTNPHLMDIFADEYGKITGHPEPAVVTGKTIENGGSEGRGGATGRGAYLAFEAIASRIGLDPETITVAIQGFGNAGQEIARQFAHHGRRVVAVSDSRGAIRNEAGLDINALIAHKTATGSVTGFLGADAMPPEDIATVPCGVFAPSALESSITKENAGRVMAKVVIELANGATEAEADAILTENGVIVIPDVLANAGGVIVSSYEWIQNREGAHWSADDIEDRLAQTMRAACHDVLDRAEKHETTLRTSAYALALERIVAAEKDRGRL